MVRRDISVILTRAPALKPALVAAYRSALPQGDPHPIRKFKPVILSEIHTAANSKAKSSLNA
jgi:hypothetical protein